MTAFSTRRVNQALDDYYRLLDDFDKLDQLGIESTTETAMKGLLLDWCSMCDGWTLIKESFKTPRGKSITPDGIIVDPFHIRRGYWEAKDTGDDLEVEILNKRRDGYPFDKNLLFDDTRTAVLFQNDHRIGDIDLRHRNELKDLLDEFFAWTNPPIEDFHLAMAEFTERLPDFAEKLHARIASEKLSNRAFVEQLENFRRMCADSLNPSVTLEQIEQMLAQHLLTERVARRVFRYDRFRETNSVARELEKLVDAFIGDAPSRDRFLAGLDQYFHAVEHYADLVYDFSEKQDFLTKVYEPFLNAYSPKEADRQGIVYTPQPIVRFIVNSVEAALNDEFGKTLADTGVHILDPCTGTGNFIVAVLKKIHEQRPSALTEKYDSELWANEIMLLPYYIAGLNIESAYQELTGEHRRFPGVCFTDTLLQTEGLQMDLLSEENAARVERQKEAPITVILGNPPYNKAQTIENQNAKNIPHPVINQRIKETYAKDSNATSLISLYDPYIQFIRWATDRIGDEGIVCFVTNNGFLDGYAADGFRKHLVSDYSEIYHFNFKGNARTSGERRRREKGNIFEDKIRVGVGITLLIKRTDKRKTKIDYHEVGDYWTSVKKRDYLSSFNSINDVKWQKPKITKEGREWFAPDNDFEEHPLLGNIKYKNRRIEQLDTILHRYSIGLNSNRDRIVYDFDSWQLEQRCEKMVEAYNLEIDRWKRSGKPSDIDNFVNIETVNWCSTLKRKLMSEDYAVFSADKIRSSLYRPFTKMYLYFDEHLNHRRGIWPIAFPTPATEEENRVICLSGLASNKPFSLIATNTIPCLDLIEKTQCFPLYVYDGSNRRENVTPWAIALFKERYPKARINRPKIFHYVYALLHAAGYREKYEYNLKKSLPRVPLLGDNGTFNELAALGEQLA
ncbi:N-6 DNA methylase, partial [bacterium]|nr:N-6 DNA methylase [bacterium]